MDFLELAKQRYAVREFENRPIEKEKIERILRAAQLAPTGRNAQPWRSYVLQTNEALKAAEACTPCIYQAPVVLLFCYDKNHPESNLKENNVNVGLTNACIAATHAMMEATEQGLGSCWVCLFYEEITKQTFNIPDNWEPACFLPIGYSSAEPGPRHFIRKPMDELVEYR